MNGINVHLATGWNAATLAAQKRSWTKIRGLSSQIKHQAELCCWDELLILAEQRDHLIASFFSQSICKPLYATVVLELEEIKRQHKDTMQRLTVALERNTARQAIIAEQRQQISDSLEPRH